MAIPEAWNRIAIRNRDVNSSYVVQSVSVILGPDTTEHAVLHREALSRWVFGIMSPHALIAVDWERVMFAVGEKERVLLERVCEDGGSDSRDEETPAKEG